MERAYWATASVGPYREFQVVVFDDAREPDAGWVRTGWFREIVVPPALIERVVAEAERGYLPEQLTPRPRGRRRGKN